MQFFTEKSTVPPGSLSCHEGSNYTNLLGAQQVDERYLVIGGVTSDGRQNTGSVVWQKELGFGVQILSLHLLAL